MDHVKPPVNLTNVKAYPKNNGVQVEWFSQQESNIDRYEVEHSQNGQDFIKVGTLVATGNRSNSSQYNFFDPNPFSDVSFYRIKIIEEGKNTYSQILKINRIRNTVNSLVIYPNPLKGNSLSLQMNLPKGNYIIFLTNKQGQRMMSTTLEYTGGVVTQTLTLPNTLSAGVYQLRLNGNNIDIVRQLIKN